MATRVLHLRLGSVPCENNTELWHHFLQIDTPARSGIQEFNTTYPFKIPSIDLETLKIEIEKAVNSKHTADRSARSEVYLNHIEPNGKSMYNAFTDKSKHILNSIMSWVVTSPDDNLLVLIQLEEIEERSAPNLTTLPWEMIHCPGPGGSTNNFLIAHPNTTIARYIPTGAIQGRENHLPSQKLKMLIVRSRFGLGGDPDPVMSGVIKSEGLAMKKALKPINDLGLIEQIYLDDPTPTEVAEQLEQDINIFHYTGHGDNSDGAYIMLRDGNLQGRGIEVGWDQLRPSFSQAPSLQLVVLNACRQAHLVSNLVKLGIPAVISMSYEIGAQVVVRSNGFTGRLYQAIAAGNAIHVAYAKALRGIWYDNTVEAFIPMLSLGKMGSSILLDPKSERVREINRKAEERQHTATQLAGLVKTTIENFVQGRTQQDFAEAQANLSKLKRPGTPVHEPEVITELETCIARLDREQKFLRDQQRWFEAQRFCKLQPMLVDLLPVERRPPKMDDCSDIDAHAQHALDEMLQEIYQLDKEMQWKKLIERAKAYLALEPQNDTISQLYQKAQKIRELDTQIRLGDDEPRFGTPAIENLFNVTTMEELAKAMEQMLHELPPTVLSDSILQELTEQFKFNEDLDPSVAVAIVKQLYELNPRNAEVRAKLLEALYEEAQQFRRTRQWKDADSACSEMLRLDPQSDKARSALCEVLRENMYDARSHYDWETVKSVATRILQEPHFSDTSIYAEAQRSHEEAEATLKLMAKIKLSDLPESDSLESNPSEESSPEEE